MSEHSSAIKKAYSEVVRISQDPYARELYEAREKQLKDMNSIRASAIEKGIQQGIEQGIEQNKRITAENLFKMGLSIEQVAQGVVLSTDEVRKIKENMQGR